MVAEAQPTARSLADAPGLWQRLMHERNFTSLGFMLPAGAMFLLFLAHPLGLGVWLGFTDARSGHKGRWMGFGNQAYLFDEPVFWLSVYNTFLYTAVASIFNFALGLVMGYFRSIPTSSRNAR